jgi:hypothetical protein
MERVKNPRGHLPKKSTVPELSVEEIMLKHSLERQVPGLMAGFSRPGFTYFCPCCRNERRLSQSPALYPPKRIFQLGLVHAVLMILLWPWLDWKGIVLALPILAIYESFSRLRFRAEMRCDFCGFEPHLYQTDLASLRQKMTEHWKSKYAAAGRPFPGEESNESSGASGDNDSVSADFVDSTRQDSQYSQEIEN